MEVFLRERFRRVPGCVDDADDTFYVEDRDCQGVRVAGVGAGLGEASRAGHGQGGVGGFDDEVYYAPVRGGQFLGRGFAEGREVGDLDQGDPIGPELAPYSLGYLLWGSTGVQVPRLRGTEHEP